MRDTVMMAELAWTEYQRRVEAGAPVIIPTGATEQHGPHLPMGVDALIPTAIARAVARRVGALVAPALAYGYKSQPKMGGGQHFCGTTSLDGSTVAHLLRDVIRELARHGVRRIVVLNGHYENTMFTIEGIDLALRELRAGGAHDVTVVRLEYWDYTGEKVLATVFPDGFPGYALEHAAVLETSLMLHLHPELVDLTRVPADGPARFPPHDVYPPRAGWVPASGALSPAAGASAAKGEMLFNDYVAGICTSLLEEFGLRPSVGPPGAAKSG